MQELDHPGPRCSVHAPKAAGLLALMGAFACAVPLNAQQAPVPADSRKIHFVSADRPLRSGSWRYRVLEGTGASWCRVMDAPSQTFFVVLENESDETLDCSISLTTQMQWIPPKSEVDKNTIVAEPRGVQLGLSVCTTGAELEGATVDCAIRLPPSPWVVPKGCTYSVVSAQPFETFYPPGSRRLREQAPVYVLFSMREREGHPADITVAASSGYERLDEAAKRYVKQLVVRTSCPSVRYRIRLSFRLDEYGEPLEPALETEAAGPAPR